MTNRCIKVLKLRKYAEGRLTIGKVYKCLDSSRYTTITDDLGNDYHIVLDRHPDHYEVVEGEA